MAKLTKQSVPFTQVANDVLNDKKLSWKAKGLFAYIFSKPHGWQFESLRIAEDSADGRDATRAGIKELEAKGYLVRVKKPSGRIEYFIKYSDEIANDGKPVIATDGISVGRESRPLSNTDKESNKEKIRLFRPPAGGIKTEGKKINDLIDLFSEVNYNHEKLFGIPAERSAMDRLVLKIGYEKCVGAIKILAKTNASKFAPTITKPTELERKFNHLVAFVQKQKGLVENKMGVAI